MKHETFNSILAALGFGLAAFTAWHQFAPSEDRLEVTSEGIVNLGRELDLQPANFGDLLDGAPVLTAGPVSWRLLVYNPSDRLVSLVGYEVFLLADDGAPIHYSQMNEKLSPLEPSLPEQNLPVVLEARTAVAYLISLSIPVHRDLSAKDKCEDHFRRLLTLQRCFFEKGRDLFGNAVTMTSYNSVPNGAFTVSWDDGNRSPLFAVVLETADGSRFSTTLSYFPGL